MANKSKAIQPSRHLTDVEELRAYAHPTRMAILSMLTERPATLSQVAKQMGVHPANLSRHFRTLEHARLIVLVEKRDTGRNLEKLYRSVAASFEPDFKGLSPADKRITVLGILRDELQAGIVRVRTGELAESDLIVLVSNARVRAKDLAAFHLRLSRLVQDFSSRDMQGGQAYTLGLSLFPAAHSAERAKEIHITEGRTE
jgi:DNA-binding transcriptional ArsR family regulator